VSVVSGSAQAGTVAFSFDSPRDHRLTNCTYSGTPRNNGFWPWRARPSNEYEFEWCDDGSRPGDFRTADYFSLHVISGNPGAGTTTVELALGLPEPAARSQVIVASDPRLAGAALSIPEGAAPPAQKFTIDLVPGIGPGTFIPFGPLGVISAGYAANYGPVGSTAEFYFDGSTCAEVNVPYNATEVSAAPLAEQQGLAVYQIVSPVNPVGSQESAARLVLVPGATIDTNQHMATFCAAHLSQYVVGMPNTQAPTYNGGAVMNTVQIYPIFYGSWNLHGFPGQTTIDDLMQFFVDLPSPPVWNIVASGYSLPGLPISLSAVGEHENS
jgi:hypothetical protein